MPKKKIPIPPATPKGPDLGRYLPQLAAISFVRDATVRPGGHGALQDGREPTRLTLKTTRGNRKIDAIVVTSHLDYVRAAGFATLRAGAEHPLLLMAPYVAAPMAKFLADRDVNFIDQAGNCRLVLDDGLHAEVVGKRAAAQGLDKGWRDAGYWTLFTVLARPELLGASVRALAQEAGVGKSAAADALLRLRRAGSTASGAQPGFLPGARATWAARWIEAYGSTLRPHAVVGRFRGPDDAPPALERRIANAMGAAPYALGGAAGAYRLGTSYRSAETVLHTPHFDDAHRRALKALPAVDGPLIVVEVAAPSAFADAKSKAAHPLLLLAEMSATAGPADDRLRDACVALKAEKLPWL